MKLRKWAQLILVAGLLPATSLAKSTDIVTRGRITRISTNQVIVSSSIYRLTAQTKYENQAGARIAFSRFNVGDIVKVKGPRVGSSLVAREMELERDLRRSSKSLLIEARRGSDDSADHDRGDDHGGRSNSDRSGDDNSLGRSNNSDSNGNSGGERRNLKFRARLVDAVGVATEAHGKLERKLEQKGRKAEERITAKVEIPVPSAAPLIADETAAREFAVSLTLSRAGVQYAICSLPFDHMEIEDDDSSILRAEYKLDLRAKTKRGTTSLRSKKGECDIDLATAGVQSGMPNIQANDTAVITGTSSISAMEFLGGVVKSKR